MLRKGKIMKLNQFKWMREPASYSVTSDKIEIITKPHTDLWQRTYYHFRNYNARFFRWKRKKNTFHLR